jgi:hypothetical protein
MHDSLAQVKCCSCMHTMRGCIIVKIPVISLARKEYGHNAWCIGMDRRRPHEPAYNNPEGLLCLKLLLDTGMSHCSFVYLKPPLATSSTISLTFLMVIDPMG